MSNRLKQTIKGVNGYDVEISTSKGARGTIECSACFGSYKQEQGYSCFSFAMFSDPYITLAKSAPGARATEKALKEIHAAGMAKFEAMRAAGELPARHVWPIGTVLSYSSRYEGGSLYVVTGETEGTEGQECYKIDGSDKTKCRKDIAKNWNQVEGEPLKTAEEIAAIIETYKAEQVRKAQEAEQAKKEAAEDKARRLEEGAKIVQAIPEGCNYVIVGNLRVDDSDSMTDYFSSHTEKVIFLAYSKTSRDSFDEFRKAAANSPETADLANAGNDYEHREKYSGGHGYYLGRSKYSGWIIEKATANLEALQLAAADGRYFIPDGQPEEPAPNFEPVPTSAGKVQVIDYSERAIAVIGDTKPIKDKLKAMGGKFNFRLSCGAGWIFPKSKLSTVAAALGTSQAQSTDEAEARSTAAAVQAQEEAYFDNFCQQSNI